MNSLYGLKDKQLTSAVWASTAWLGLEVLFERVSQLERRGGGVTQNVHGLSQITTPFICVDSPSSFLHHELLVVGDGPKEGLVQQVPGDVFHHGGVTGEDRLRLYDLPLLRHGTYVPQTDCLGDKARDFKK